MAAEGGERTEAATPRRRQEARAKGQAARSPELVSALIILGAFGALALGGRSLGHGVLAIMESGLDLGGRADLRPEGVRLLLLAAARGVALAALPVALVVLVAGLVGNVAQVGFLVSTEPLRPDWARLSPLAGLRRLVSAQGLVELLKAVLKLAIVGAVAWRTLAPEWGRFGALGQTDPRQLAGYQAGLAVRLGLRVGAIHLLLALGDYLYQRWRFERGLRMTRTEVAEEARQQEGSPHLRARVRTLQRERAMRRMMEAVPRASVVVVNPIHVAVALRYDAATMRAPRVVAKGRRLVAERIVAIARAAGVPVVQDVPLARALEKAVEVGAEIPAAFYRAVAQILAYVYARDPARAAAAAGGGRRAAGGGVS